MIEFNDALRERLRANLAAHERRVLDLGDRRHAAVALVIVDSDSSATSATRFRLKSPT